MVDVTYHRYFTKDHFANKEYFLFIIGYVEVDKIKWSSISLSEFMNRISERWTVNLIFKQPIH